MSALATLAIVDVLLWSMIVFEHAATRPAGAAAPRSGTGHLFPLAKPGARLHVFGVLPPALTLHHLFLDRLLRAGAPFGL